MYNWDSVYNPNGPMVDDISMITNADTGILLSWDSFHESTEYSTRHAHMAITSGASASVVDSSLHSVVPVLQLQDGSFVGTALDSTDSSEEARYMVAFDAGGGLRWSVSGYTPQIATADGGLIATSDSGAAVVFDRNGSATGQMSSLLTQSWIGNMYEVGSTLRRAVFPTLLATSFAAAAGENLSGNWAAALPLPDRVKAVYDVVQPDPFGAGAVRRNITYKLYQGVKEIPPSRGAVIKEGLLYSYGQKPQPSESDPGEDFDDFVGTSGKEDFGLTQQFFAMLQGKPPIRVQIVPCIANGTFGNPDWQNIIRATSTTVLINGDAGSPSTRTCRSQQ